MIKGPAEQFRADHAVFFDYGLPMIGPQKSLKEAFGQGRDHSESLWECLHVE